MPLLGFAIFLIGLGFAYHAYSTGRPQFWPLVLIFVPIAGSIAYIIFELLPELANTQRARKVSADARTVVDPHREWRRLSQAADETDSVEAKAKLGEECERKGMWPEAIQLYQRAAQGAFADDPDILRRLARAQLGSGDSAAALETLDAIRQENPSYQDQDAHLTYARALQAQGNVHEACDEYRDLVAYATGLEARTRYALLLQKMDQPVQAKAIFEQVVRAGKASGAVLSEGDQQWLKVAKNQL